jgi:hypothetical protein
MEGGAPRRLARGSSPLHSCGRGTERGTRTGSHLARILESIPQARDQSVFHESCRDNLMFGRLVRYGMRSAGCRTLQASSLRSAEHATSRQFWLTIAADSSR